MNRSRRAVVAAGLGLIAIAAAGCTKAVQARQSTPAAQPPVDSSTPSTASTRRSAPVTSSTTSAEVTEPPTSSARTPFPTRHPTTDSPTPATSRPTTKIIGPARQIAHGPLSQPHVALTFHGAGDIGYAWEILRIARSKHAHITVMAVGTWLAQNPAIGREILSGGHDIGNHTLSHVDINSLPADGMRAEVVGCRDILQRTTGTPGTYFRQSQSQTANQELLEIAGLAGYRVCLSYNLDSMDWTDPGPRTVRQNVAEAGPGSIVSMHLGHSDTVTALPEILDDLTARGLSAVTVTKLLSA